MTETKIVRAAACEQAPAAWGGLTWYASRRLGNSEALTLGRCIIKPGCCNPLHSHPNCAELLVVLQGRIAHTIEGGREVELGPGDVIALPPHLPHNARNVGAEEAVLIVAFSSADRQVKGE